MAASVSRPASLQLSFLQVAGDYLWDQDSAGLFLALRAAGKVYLMKAFIPQEATWKEGSAGNPSVQGCWP